MIDVNSERGTERTDAGLIVPAGTQEKRKQRWEWDAWKKIDRGIKELSNGGGIIAILACGKCGKRFAAKLNDRGFEMECACTVHSIVRR